MSLPVVFLTSAERDLKELKNYIVKNFGQPIWLTTYHKIKDSIKTIQTFSLRGALPEELEKINLTQYRQVISEKNRIIYEVRKQAIYIHLICDARKDLRSVLLKRLLHWGL